MTPVITTPGPSGRPCGLARDLLSSGSGTFAEGATMRRRQTRRGQSTVEYMMLISVIVIAVVAAAYVFVPVFQEGVNNLALDVKDILSTGEVVGTGTQR